MPRKPLTEEQKQKSREKRLQKMRERNVINRFDKDYYSKELSAARLRRKRSNVDGASSSESPQAKRQKRLESMSSNKRTHRADEIYLLKEAKSKRIKRRRKKCMTDVAPFKRAFDLNMETNCPEFKKLSEKFFKAISEGPTHVCYCCDRLWFKSSIKFLNKTTLKDRLATDEFINFVFYKDDGDEGKFCKTCYDQIRKLKIPKLATKNGFIFPEIPDCLKNLSPLEERLVSNRIPFMQIRPLGVDKQYGIKGSVVNVPIDLDTTVNVLPRNLDEQYTVHVKLKRRLTFKSDYMYEIINPERVFRAASYLKQQELYEQLNINLNLDWYDRFQRKDFDVENLIRDCETEVDENEEPVLNPGSTHTLICGDKGICIAPGENKTPVSVMFDNFAEELSFPTIYCGKARHFESNPTYLQVANSEIRRSDRRATRPDHLLYIYCKYLKERILNAMGIALRKKKSLLPKIITAGNLLDETFIDDLVTHNEGYKFLRSIKSAPAHWETEKHRLFAAIRQFGLPTIFVTVSAAETHWYDLMNSLSMNLDKKEISEEDFRDMPYDQKCKLIQSDPVTCALHFDHRFRELKKTWNSKRGPFCSYSILHSYYRIEFQHRGSPHAHMLLWLENAPDYSKDGLEKCEAFVDEIMTCSISNPFVEYQRHKHSFTCRKKKNGKEYCRFNMPYFPMDKTRIVEPFEKDDERRSEKQYEKLVEYLSKMDDSSYMPFDDFLGNLKLSLGQYLNVIKSGINRPTVLLKRDVDEIMINNYNPKIINLMRSNMDIQFILNGYACVAYMVDYINKSQRGMSKLLKQCIEETKNGNHSLRSSLAAVANQFINASEISAQEAAWSVLELPMSRLSEVDIFIPTFLPGDRARVLKSQEQLKKIPKNCEKVFEMNILDRYVLRPIKLKNLCLADFATDYEFEETGNSDMRLLDDSLYARKRTKRKILRHVGYKEQVDKMQYFREQLMLYTSWRDEKKDILDKNFEAEFTAKKEQIEGNRKPFNGLEFDLESIVLEENDDPDAIAELTVDDGGEDEEIELNYDDNELKADINRDMEEYVGKEFDVFKIQSRLPKDEYSALIRKANVGQHGILKHLMYLTLMTTEPYHIFITGPAGSGKSYTIHAITETLNRLYDKRGSDPSATRILKVAPTGKAAYNISGLTLHGAFALPTKVGKVMCELSPATANEYRALYRNLKLVIIDEISMVGFNMFKHSDQRLRQIMDLDEPFGGLSVIAFGDFRQLPPVRDSPVYQIPKNLDLNHMSGNVLWDKFQLYELTEIMRQKDDLLFANCLNNMANGTMTEEEVLLIENRITDSKSVPDEAIQLFYSNKEVDAYNIQKLLKLDSEEFISEALDYVNGIGSRSSKQYLRRTLKTMNKRDTGNLPYSLHLKINAKYMLTNNVQTSDGLVNGVMGILKKIEYCGIKNSDKISVKRIWLEFENEKIGRMARKKSISYALKNKINLSYTLIERNRVSIEKTRKTNGLTATRFQFPVQIAEAITIHKSQGATYSECVVNLQPTMSASLLYVACSRATKASGLNIIGKFKPPTKSKDDRVTVELARLRENPLIPEYRFLHERGDYGGMQFVYHNVQSLPAHFEDMKADPCFMNSDMIFLAETWTLPSDDFDVPGFKLIERIDGEEEIRPHSGLHVYVSDQLEAKISDSWALDSNGLQMAVVNILNKYRFVLVYASPQMSNDEKLAEILTLLDPETDVTTILVGDFNVNFDTEEGREFADELLMRDLRLRTNPKQYTTRGGTSIDAIFSDRSMRTGVYMSTYSYHMPLYGRIDYNKQVSQ